MKTSSAMLFQRTLLLTAFVAFTSALPTTPSPSQCETITVKLQTALRPRDPHTFPDMSNFTYTHDDTSLLFNFINVTFDGFSSVTCKYFNTFEYNKAELTLSGRRVGFRSPQSHVHGLLNGEPHSSRSSSSLVVTDYSLALRFQYEPNPPKPLSLCIVDGSLEMTPIAEASVTQQSFADEVSHELNSHPIQLLQAVTQYLPRLANNLTTALNEIFCDPADIVPPPPRPPTPEPEVGRCCGVSDLLSPDCCLVSSSQPSAFHPSRYHPAPGSRPGFPPSSYGRWMDGYGLPRPTGGAGALAVGRPLRVAN